MKVYQKVKLFCSNIQCIFTDANSCYDVAFTSLNIPEEHVMTKAETHLIESSNSSIRDNLARFNRRSKRFLKALKCCSLPWICSFIDGKYYKQCKVNIPFKRGLPDIDLRQQVCRAEFTIFTTVSVVKQWFIDSF